MQRTLLSCLIFLAVTSGQASANSASPTESVKSNTSANNSANPGANPGANPARVSGIDFQWLDPSVRPQDDFFGYMSGKWLKSVAIPADRGRFGTMDAMRDQSEQQLRGLVDHLLGQSKLTAGSNQQKIADLYKSFMNEAQIEQQDIAPLQNDLARIDAIADHSALLVHMAQLARHGISSPVGAFVGQDGRDATRHAVMLSQSGLGLPERDYYLNPDEKFANWRSAYLKHISNMLAMSGQFAAEADGVAGTTASKGEGKAENKAETKVDAKADAKRALPSALAAAQAILALETELAKIHWSRVDNRDPVKTYNKLTLTQLAELAPELDWQRFLASHGSSGKVDYVIVRQPDYLKKLGPLLKQTPLAIWQAYAKWHTINSFAPFLSQRFVDADFAFNSVLLRGIPENQPRWKRAIGRVEESLPEALGQLYVEKYFPPEHKARMQALVDNVQLAYRQSIEQLPWMSDATKQQALNKLAKFHAKIGYPDVWRDYSKLAIAPDNLLQNVKNGREQGYARQLAKLGQKVDKQEWGMSPQTVNAYYSPRQNEIVFPAAILTPPMFNPAADDAVNYGAIGGVIGHEISHGFDDAGSQSDGDGNLRDWWQGADRGNFKKLAEQLTQQYEAYSPLPGYHLNGKLTLGENLADNSGLAIAYKAYQLSLKGQKSPVIDGLTGEQRVLMGWAQVWRGKAREAESIRLINTDPHSPARFRANGPLSNLPGFYEAFGVKPGDGMYVAPEKRTVIW